MTALYENRPKRLRPRFGRFRFLVLSSLIVPALCLHTPIWGAEEKGPKQEPVSGEPDSRARFELEEVVVSGTRVEETVKEVSMAKNFATDVCDKVCYEAVQIHGGYGYMREYVIERLYRDSRILSIGGGTTEIMKEIIAGIIL